MKKYLRFIGLSVLTLTARSVVSAQAYSEFSAHVMPFLENYCLNCHDDEIQKGNVALHDLEEVTPENAGMWTRVWEMTTLKKMPPVDRRKQPAIWDRHVVSQWITQELQKQLEDHGGFPKPEHPKKGNHIDHQLLFNTDLQDLE